MDFPNRRKIEFEGLERFEVGQIALCPYSDLERDLVQLDGVSVLFHAAS